MLNLVRSLYLNNIPQLYGLDVEVWAEIISLALWCPQQPPPLQRGGSGKWWGIGGTGAMDSQRREAKKKERKKERKKDKVESDNENGKRRKISY